MQPHGTHPFLDEHITEAAALALIAMTSAGDTWGLGPWWRTRTGKWPWLR